MWTRENQAEFKAHIAKLSDDELIKIVCEDFEDYREEALQLVDKELAIRGIELEDSLPANVGESPAENVITGKVTICQVCQAEMRSGVLFTGKEVTIFFTDRNEERFVEVLACSRCGQVRMVVDYETIVDN